MKMPDRIDERFLAACGINCLTCSAQLKPVNRCSGCLGPTSPQRKSCLNCKIKHCARERGFLRCFECSLYPCTLVKSLNKRYFSKYLVNIPKNNRIARTEGISALMCLEKKRFTCAHCGGIVSQHSGVCSDCSQPQDTAEADL